MDNLTPHAPGHSIVITHDSEGFHVSVEPRPEGADLTSTYPTHRGARGYAGGLRMVNRWPICDRTCNEGLNI